MQSRNGNLGQYRNKHILLMSVEDYKPGEVVTATEHP